MYDQLVLRSVVGFGYVLDEAIDMATHMVQVYKSIGYTPEAEKWQEMADTLARCKALRAELQKMENERPEDK